MGCKIKKKMVDDIPILELHGNVTGGDAIKVSKKLEAFVKKKNDKVVVDLSFIDFIDSSWLGSFVYSWKLYCEYDKKLIFLIPEGKILEIFRMSNLDKTFDIIDSLEHI